jgi:glutathione synthase/RimK-type ligase-like ATP-grasp enzyme
MLKIAILVSDNMMPGFEDTREDIFELDEQMGKITPAFKAQGMTAELLRWREAASQSENFDAMLPLFVWDYFEGNEDAFLAEMAKAETKTKLFNRFDVLQWNATKTYLDELERQGAPVIRTLNVERVTERNVVAAFETLKTDTLVIKPQVGGGAWRQVLYKQGDPFPAKDELPPEAAMIQAFLPSVKTEGEYSFLYFGGQFSHAVNKRPKDGDYRIQSIYGGTEQPYTPTSQERETARQVLDTLEFTPLYARVDLLRGRDETLKLIELEMLEPYLYLPFAKGEDGDNEGAQKLAKALKKRLSTA